MKKRMYVLLACLLSAVLAFSLVGCGGSLTISDESLALTVGDTKQLTLKSGDEDVTDSAEWTTEDQKIVTVSSRGNVSAKAPGTAKVTGTYEGKSATCTVSVTAKEVVEVKITDESGTEITSASVDRGATITLKATTSNDSDVTWSSGDTAYATVAPVSGQKNTATVTGVFPTTTPVKIYAKSGSTQVGVDLTVNKPADNPTWYDMALKNEDGSLVEGGGSAGQNKSPLGRWTFWRDQAGWNAGNADMGAAEYLGDSADSMAGSIHLSYTNGIRSTGNNAKAPDTVQITFRSPKTAEFANGLLETGKYYKLTAEITVGFEGVVTINGTETLLHSGKNNVEIWFQHTDDGVMHGATDYDIYRYPAFYMTMGSYKEDTFVPEADITIAKLQWEEFTPTALSAPTVAVSGGKVTVTDTANTAANVDSYEIGFFATADAQTPKYTVKATAGEETTINSASWDNGTYTVKARALSAKGNYTDSPWSTATDVTYTVEHEALVYDLQFSASADIKADGWYYWNELGEEKGADNNGVVEAKFNDGTLTYEFAKTAGNWISNQLFFCNTSLSAGTYQITFTMTSSVAGKITVNNTVVTFTEDALTQQVKVNGAPGQMMISIQFGVQSTPSAIQAGRFTITDIDITSGGSQPQPGGDNDIVSGEEKRESWTGAGTVVAVEHPDTWVYWNDQNYNNSGCTVTVSKHELVDGVAYFTYSATGTNWYGFQVFYEKSGLTTGTAYTLTLVLHSNVAGKVTINDQQFDIIVGDNNLTVNYTESEAASFKLIMGTTDGADQTTFISSAEISLKDLAWTAQGGTQPQPQPPTPGTKYTPKYEKSVQGAEMTSEWDTVGTDNNPDTWVYWYVADATWGQGAVVTEFEAKFEGNAFVVTYKDGEKDYSVQVFYKNSELVAGQTYTLTCKINASVQTQATINGKGLTLNAGDNTITVAFVLNAAGAETNGTSAIDFQFPAQTAKITLKISDVEWTAGDTTGGTQPETPAGGKEITVTNTEWYGVTFVKLSMSADDLALVGSAANCKVNNADVQPHGGNKGFLVDGVVLQVQLPEAYGEGKTYNVVWYDAQGNAIAHATFSYQA